MAMGLASYAEHPDWPEVSSWSQVLPSCQLSTANHIGSWCDDTAFHV